MFERLAAGRTDLIFDLLEQGHPVDARDVDGVTLAQWCAYYGDVSGLRYLVSRGAKLDVLGENLDLNGAAFHGHWRLCEFLVECGADADRAQDATGESPLHAACTAAARPRAVEVVRVLLAAGADPNRPTRPGVLTASLMREVRTRGETPLHRAAAFGSLEIIDLLLAAGARRDGRDAVGDSPLSWASWHQRPGPILERLCFGPHRLHPDAVARMQSDHGHGSSGMDRNLTGRSRT